MSLMDAKGRRLAWVRVGSTTGEDRSRLRESDPRQVIGKRLSRPDISLFTGRTARSASVRFVVARQAAMGRISTLRVCYRAQVRGRSPLPMESRSSRIRKIGQLRTSNPLAAEVDHGARVAPGASSPLHGCGNPDHAIRSGSGRRDDQRKAVAVSDATRRPADALLRATIRCPTVCGPGWRPAG